MNSYCFRTRFILAPTSRLEISETELALTEASESETVALASAEKPKLISETTNIVLRGSEYPSKEAATAAANAWRSALQLAFARLRIAADFGDRAPGGGLTPYGLELVRRHDQKRDQPDVQPLNDVHGTMVYRSEPQPVFVRMGPARIRLSQPVHRVKAAMTAARSSSTEYSDRERLAYDLFSASSFQPSPDGRFVMLMMALETLITLEPRDELVCRHVDSLVLATKQAGLAQSEISSVIGSLNWLYQESISQAGRRLSKALSTRRYMGQTPSNFFTNCYALRSRLVHGTYPRPTRREVGSRVASLEVFVADLLSGPLRDDESL